jgi:hypothetical protein
MKKILITTIVLLLVNTAVYGQALDAFIDILKTDVKIQKSTIIRVNMKLTKAEGDKFWPVYKNYEHDLDKINDERIAVIRYYARNYNHLTDEESEELAKKVFKWREKRIKLKKNYYKKFKKVSSSKTATKFFQLENQLSLLYDLQIASKLPLIK